MVALLATLTLSACTVTGGSDFTSLYNSHVKAEINSAKELLNDMGLNKNEEAHADMRMALVVPEMLSGSFQTQIEAVSNGIQKSEARFVNPSLVYEGMFGSGSFHAAEISVIQSMAGQQYALFKDIVASESLIPQAAQDVLKEYSGKWLDISSTEDLSYMSEEERIGFEVGQKLYTLSAEEFEKYLTKYPIFVATGEGTASGEVVSFPVEMSKKNIVNLAEALTRDLTNTGLTFDEAELGNVDLKGTIAYKKNDPMYIDANLTLSQSGVAQGTVRIEREKDKLHMTVTNPENSRSFDMSFVKTDANTHTVDMTFAEAGNTVATMNAVVKSENKKLRSLNAKLSAQGMEITLTHTQDDTNMNGSLTSPVGEMTWKGTRENKTLTSFQLNGSSPLLGSITMDLTKDGDMVKGPLKVVVQGTEVFSATVGLQSVGSEKFGFTLSDIVAPSAAVPAGTHFELFVTNGQRKDTSKKIQFPTNAIPVQELIDKLDAVTPTSSYETDLPYDETGMDDGADMGDAYPTFELPVEPTE